MSKKPCITFFTREGCHLCEKAKTVIEELRSEIEFEYKECDISQKYEWTEQYGLMIPVIMIDGEIIQFGQIDQTTILKRLQSKKDNAREK
jgi:glutaredoxin